MLNNALPKVPFLWGQKNAAIVQADIKAAEKLVLLVLFSFADNYTDNCFPSIPTIALWAGYTDRAVQLILKALEERGIIRKQVRVNPRNKCHTSNMYWINFPQLTARSWEPAVESAPAETEFGASPGGELGSPPGDPSSPITDPSNKKEITNSLTLTRSIKKTSSNTRSEQELEKTNKKAVKTAVNSLNEETTANAVDQSSNSKLEVSEQIIHPTLDEKSSPNGAGSSSAQRRTTSDASRNIFGQPRNLEWQKQKALGNSDVAMIAAGVKNARWKDSQEFRRFEAYLTEHVRLCNLGLKKGFDRIGNPAGYIREVLKKTAACDQEDAVDLAMWKNWTQELPGQATITVSQPKVLIDTPADLMAEIRAFKAKLAVEKAARLKAEEERQRRINGGYGEDN